ncbi:hypothetical protein KRP69_01845 [Mammaliicoccus sciuri]|uniref:hypothetical protein n=1 Tax=Mammaliicoccus sciuri TaxID=1296 RepID=UPI001D0D74AD|nr:hypothetical protein [Mammaliicoccus sciuri]MCC2087948.1 hypothetical protein [Mammaliicoccus sciuri]
MISHLDSYEKLWKVYHEQVQDIKQFLLVNMVEFNRNIFIHAFDVEEYKDATPINHLEIIRVDGEEYEIKSVNYKKQTVILDDDREVAFSELERTRRIADNCVGTMYKCEGTFNEFVEKNLNLVAEIGFDIFIEDIVEDNAYYLGISSGIADRHVTHITPIFNAYEEWRMKEFNLLKSEVKSYE